MIRLIKSFPISIVMIFLAGGLILAEDITLTAITVPSSGGIGGTYIATASGSWTVPSGVNRVIVEILGGGGSGDKSYVSYGGGGGGAGAYMKLMIPVEKDDTLDFTVGGAQTTSPADGNSTVLLCKRSGQTLLTATAYGGCGGGRSGSGYTNFIGGRGGECAALSTSITGVAYFSSRGMNGQFGGTSGNDYGGGNGGSSIYGGGGHGEVWNFVIANRLPPGNGGRGAGGGGGLFSFNGGTGGSGLVVITW
jgi:hypothetical protein